MSKKEPSEFDNISGLKTEYREFKTDCHSSGITDYHRSGIFLFILVQALIIFMVFSTVHRMRPSGTTVVLRNSSNGVVTTWQTTNAITLNTNGTVSFVDEAGPITVYPNGGHIELK